MLFFIFSFVVKLAQNALLGTWEHPNFFGIPSDVTYMMGWSLVDGMTPVANAIGISIVAKFVDGLVVPTPKVI